jgi:hypothetical protein
MPECIVCKGYYEPGQRCERCGWDNVRWDRWKAGRAEEQGGLAGLLAFSWPHFHLPLLVALFALPFGLMGVGGLWTGIAPAAQLLAVAITPFSCSIAALAGHSARHEIREQELLNRVRQGRFASLAGVRLRAIVVPAFSLLLVLLVVLAMVRSDFVWNLAEWFLLDPVYLKHIKELEQLERLEAAHDATPEEEQSEEDGDLRERISRVVPFALMGMYVAFMTTFAYSSSLLLALVYARDE